MGGTLSKYNTMIFSNIGGEDAFCPLSSLNFILLKDFIDLPLRMRANAINIFSLKNKSAAILNMVQGVDEFDLATTGAKVCVDVSNEEYIGFFSLLFKQKEKEAVWGVGLLAGELN